LPWCEANLRVHDAITDGIAERIADDLRVIDLPAREDGIGGLINRRTRKTAGNLRSSSAERLAGRSSNTGGRLTARAAAAPAEAATAAQLYPFCNSRASLTPWVTALLRAASPALSRAPVKPPPTGRISPAVPPPIPAVNAAPASALQPKEL